MLRLPKLKAMTPPSVRHPTGLPRCQRLRKLKDGRLVQCKRVASWQLGASTCGVHGAGWPVRVMRGERQNPVMSSLESGRRATRSTIGIALGDEDLRDVVFLEAIWREFQDNRRRIYTKIAAVSAEVEAAFGKRKRGRPSKAEAEERRRLQWEWHWGWKGGKRAD